MSGEISDRRAAEPRWPPALAVLILLFLLTLLGGRVRVFPQWVSMLMTAVALLPMAAVQLGRGRAPWRRVERWVTLLFVLVVGGATLQSLTILIRAIIGRSSEIGGLQLFTSSIAAWVTNVLVFSLLYWQIDRGGPEARANGEEVLPDWLFPQEGAPEHSPPGWRPTYVDYLFLGYVTATAFSPTDALPMTSRAKLLVMMESAISLATIVVVAARAINILGS